MLFRATATGRYVVLTREKGHANKINIVYSIQSINTTSLDQTLAFQRLASFVFVPFFFFFFSFSFLRSRLFASVRSCPLPRRAPPLFPARFARQIVVPGPSRRLDSSQPPREPLARPYLCPLSKFTSTPSPSNRLYTFPTENFPSNPAHSFL